MTDTANNLAQIFSSLTVAITHLTQETARARGFTAALEERIAALEAKAAGPAYVPTTTHLDARGPVLTTFERATRPVRDGQW